MKSNEIKPFTVVKILNIGRVTIKPSRCKGNHAIAPRVCVRPLAKKSTANQ